MPVCEPPCAEAQTRGYCTQCLSSNGRKPPRIWLRFDRCCIVCGAIFKGRKYERYCHNHKYMRYRRQPQVGLKSDAEEVRFQRPDPVELLEQATDSIRIVRPDGTVDEERTKIERGKWLTRRLQEPWDQDEEEQIGLEDFADEPFRY